jgi:murein DD-endopeptidase MepM/ murein hydrolase activator NlpD
MKQLSPDDGFPTRLFCASLARLFMLFLGLLGVLFRATVPAAPPAQENANFQQSREEHQRRLTLRTKPGDTLESLLVRHQLNLPSADELIQKLRPFLNVPTLPVGQNVDLVIDTTEDSVRAFEVVMRKRAVRANATAEGWSVDQWTLPFMSRLRVIHGTVTDDFARSLRRAGLAPEQVTQLRKIFLSDVDVFQDSKRGDAFAVVATERLHTDGQRSVGPLAAASLTISGEVYNAFAHGEINGEARYFDTEGVRLPHWFLAAPLKYDRISSTFGLARPDPMTGIVRPHEAIDYVAVAGTPVISIGPGVVESAGWQGGYGYRVEINHGGGYVSSYGHLSSFGENVSVGRGVQAGDVIGYVGVTGRSTGPHLHFEFSRDQEKLDYLSARIYAGEKLSGAELRRFHIARDEKLAAMRDGSLQISQLRNFTFY